MSAYETARADLATRLTQTARLQEIHRANNAQREMLANIHARKQHDAGRGIKHYTQEMVFHHFLNGIARQELEACPLASGALRADIEAEVRHHALLRDAANALKQAMKRNAERAELMPAALEHSRKTDQNEQLQQARAHAEQRARKRRLRRPPNCPAALRRAALIGSGAAVAPPISQATETREQIARIIHKVTEPM